MYLSTVSKFLSEDGTMKAVVWRSAGEHAFQVTTEGRGFSASVGFDDLVAAEQAAGHFCGLVHDVTEPAPEPVVETKPSKAPKKAKAALEAFQDTVVEDSGE